MSVAQVLTGWTRKSKRRANAGESTFVSDPPVALGRLHDMLKADVLQSDGRQSSATMRSGNPAARWRSDRGAIIIHVAVAMLGLLAFSAFSIDHGLMMVSRSQAQNAANAVALAAALALAWDDPNDQPGAQAAPPVSLARRRTPCGAPCPTSRWPM